MIRALILHALIQRVYKHHVRAMALGRSTLVTGAALDALTRIVGRVVR